MIDVIHPGLLLILAAGVVPLLRGWPRPVVAVGATLGALYIIWHLPQGHGQALEYFGYSLTPLLVDGLGRLFALAFGIIAAVATLYCCRQARGLELSAALVYAGSAIGAVLAGDLITLFICWELMAIGSTVVIWSAGTPAAWRASLRYLQIHLFGGVLLMAGLAGHIAASGSLHIVPMQPDSLAHGLILAGFLINAAAWPLSAWLADAYPEASFSGMVFLSAFTTKTAVYVLLRMFPGVEILIPIGLVMVFYGIIYALLENDMRRLLAYSIVNQVGFMLVGIGIGTDLALNGAAAQAFVHILYKGLLLMTAGAVLYQTGRHKCSDLGGLFQSMPLTTGCAIVGALTVMAFPLTAGFVTKAMISSATAGEHMTWVWLLLSAGSAGAVLHAGLKYPWFVFFQGDSGLRPADPPWNMRLAMLVLAFLCIVIGMAPCQLYRLLPYGAGYEPYTGDHVVAQLQLLLFAGLAFFLMRPWLRATRTISLDTDWLYRRALPACVPAVYALAGWANRQCERGFGLLGDGTAALLRVLGRQDDRLANDVAIGESVFMVALLLGICLLLYLA